MRLGGGGHSPPDQISAQGDHASRRDPLHPHRRGVRSFRDGVLGRLLYGLLRFRHSVLDRMAQPGHLECGHDGRAGSGISAGCALSVRRPPTSPVPSTRTGSGSRRCVYGRAGHLRIRQDARGSHRFPRALVCADSCAHLGGAPLRPWGNQRLDVDHHVSGDLGNHARARPVPGAEPRRECARTTAVPPGDRRSADAARGRHRRGKTLEGSVAREREPDGSRCGSRKPGHVGVGCVRQMCG